MIARKKKIFTKRIIADIHDLKSDPVQGIFINFDEKKLDTIQALIIGPKDTPYENGIYYFTLKFPKTYPFESPKAKFETINGNIRFNPNLYEGGKVCLSILGTWSGPKWSSIQTIKSVLLSIQSLMNDNPIINEPSFENTKKDNPSAIEYVEYIRYHNYSFALLEMVRNKDFYPYFNDIVEKHFNKNYLEIIKKLEILSKENEGKIVRTPIWNKSVQLDYKNLIKEYKETFEKINLS